MLTAIYEVHIVYLILHTKYNSGIKYRKKCNFGNPHFLLQRLKLINDSKEACCGVKKKINKKNVEFISL